jgi:hypothetical protein
MKKLITRQKIAENTKMANQYKQLEAMLNVLEARNLPQETTDFINQEIERLNAIADADKSFARTIKNTENKILRYVEKKHKIVPQKYYAKLWLVLGMSAFGIPLGVAYGLVMKNMGLLGIGLPIGMGVGAAFGTYLDKKALNEGRQLDIEIK